MPLPTQRWPSAVWLNRRAAPHPQWHLCPRLAHAPAVLRTGNPRRRSAHEHTPGWVCDSRRRDCHSADIPSPSLLGRGEAVNRSGKQCIHKRQRKSSARQRQAANGSEITQGTAVKRSERQQNDRPADGQAPTAVVLRRRAHPGPSRPAGTPTSTCLGVPHHITDYHGLSTKRPESPRIAMQRASMSIKWP